MATSISILLLASAIILAIPVYVFVIEVVAAVVLPSPQDVVLECRSGRPSVAILIPAHNERLTLGSTLEDAKAQLKVGDRIIVVADNCSDDTAAIAAEMGAEVVTRDDPHRQGKGYALAAGLSYLAAKPPGVVVMLDADCRLDEQAIDKLTTACLAKHRPVQALYLMISAEDCLANSHVAEFAWRIKNWVRPFGLRALALPCQLMGAGMAFPWNLIRSVDLATGVIVEDLKLGIDLALMGHSSVFYPAARVTSLFPLSSVGARSQRVRWEKGHIGMILTTVPRLLIAAIVGMKFDPLILALDLAVPPLFLLAFLLIIMSVVSGCATFFGAFPSALIINLTSLVGFALALVLSWFRYGRDILPPRRIFSIFSYALDKLPLYYKMLSSNSGEQWVRTDRGRD